MDDEDKNKIINEIEKLNLDKIKIKYKYDICKLNLKKEYDSVISRIQQSQLNGKKILINLFLKQEYDIISKNFYNIQHNKIKKKLKQKRKDVFNHFLNLFGLNRLISKHIFYKHLIKYYSNSLYYNNTILLAHKKINIKSYLKQKMK